MDDQVLLIVSMAAQGLLIVRMADQGLLIVHMADQGLLILRMDDQGLLTIRMEMQDPSKSDGFKEPLGVRMVTQGHLVVHLVVRMVAQEVKNP